MAWREQPTTSLMYIVIAIVAWAYLELMLFLYIADEIGWLTTFLVTIATGIAGIAVARSQGLRVLREIQQQTREGRLPVASLQDGMMIFLAGVLLFIPGLICDVLGILLLVPPVRTAIRHWIAERLRERVARGDIRVMRTVVTGTRSSEQDGGEIIEGEVIHGNLEQRPVTFDDGGSRSS